MGLYDSPTHIIQQSRARAFAHVGLETLAHSRGRIDEEHVSSMILDEDPAMSILVPILLPHVFIEDGEMIHQQKVPGRASRRKSAFFPQLGL